MQESDDFQAWNNEMRSWTPGQDYSIANIDDLLAGLTLNAIADYLIANQTNIDIPLPPRSDEEDQGF